MHTSPTSATMITSPTLLTKHLKVAAISEPESYLLDHLKFMLTQEKQYQVQGGTYLLPSSSSQCIITTTDRRTMCDWSYTIVDACNIDREMSCIGTTYFDRFMSSTASSKVATEAHRSRRTFQLAYIACLIIALKCRGGMQVDANFVSETICRNQYDSNEINTMECEVLRALTYKLNGPSPHEFVDGIIQLLPSIKKNEEEGEEDDENSDEQSLMMKTLTKLAKTRVEETMLDHRSMNKTASSIAFVALLSALRETRVLDALHPLNVMTWMSRIGQVCCGGTGESMRNILGLIEGLGDLMKPQPFLRELVPSMSPARSISSEEEDNDYYDDRNKYYCQIERRSLKYSTLKRRYEELYHHHTYGEESMYSDDTLSSSSEQHRQQRARSFSPKFRRTQSHGSSSATAFTRGCSFGSFV
jgi:hypothetical protein